ncbi:MAG: ATPase [Clostridiaceae bacterium]|nr:ATPase [Clostridiaceae bacterium]
MDSKIEQGIEDIYGFIESCKMQSFSTTKVIVPKNDLYDLLDDLRRDVPTELKRFRKILNQRDAILEDAEKKAAEILAEARKQYSVLVEEHNIMQEAYQQAEATVQQANAQAEEIVENARKQANEIANGALYYTADMLDMAEKALSNAYDSTVNNAKALEVALGGHLEIIRQNRAELALPEEAAPVSASAASGRNQDEKKQAYEEEYAADKE